LPASRRGALTRMVTALAVEAYGVLVEKKPAESRLQPGLATPQRQPANGAGILVMPEGRLTIGRRLTICPTKSRKRCLIASG
jgi:hypothetical protein